MTAFTSYTDPRDLTVNTLVGTLDTLGVLVMVVMEAYWPEPIKTARLSFMLNVSDERKTLGRVLDKCQRYGYLDRTGTSPHETVHLTDLGRRAIAMLNASHAASTALPALPSASSAQPATPLSAQIVDNFVDKPVGDFLRHTDLSSSDRSSIDQQSIDRSSIEEEELRQKIAWLDQHNVGGDKRQAILASQICTAERLEAMLTYWQREGKTANGEAFRSKKYGALNYALTCALDSTAITPALPRLRSTSDASADAGEGRGEGTDDAENFSEPEKVEPPSQPLPTFDGVPIFQNPIKIWQAAQGELQLQMTRATFDTWVKNTCGIDYTDDTITVAVQNEHAREWWDTRVKTTAQRIVTGIIGQHTDVRFTVWRSA